MKMIILFIIFIINNTASASIQISNLIIPIKYFTNHSVDISKINSNLENYNNTALVGINGIGKTQLARMYAYKTQKEYQIIWFFDCNVDLNEQFVDLAKIINDKLIKNSDDKISDNIKYYLI